jgi:HK97 family phage major capsid protein
MVVKAMVENKSSIQSVQNTTQKFQVKTVGDMTTVANLTGNIPYTYRPGLVPLPFENIHARNLFTVTPSETDSYHFYRHTLGEGAINWQGGEANAKQQIDEDLVETTVNLDYLAGYLKVSRKMLRNFSALQSYLGRWLPERYYQAEDTKAWISIVGQATGATDSTGTDMISRIIRTIGAQKQARYNPNAIIIDGNVWAKILTYKSNGEFTQPIGVVNVLPTGQLTVCGIPVYTATWVGGDEAIILDTRYFEIIQSEGLSLQFFEQDSDNVTKNKITARIEASVGFAVLDPAAISVLALEAVS